MYVEFCEILFWGVYWDDHIIFILSCVNVMYHTLICDTEMSLLPRNKFYLIKWSFSCIFEFSLPIFCWGFLYPYSLDLLAYNFFFFFWHVFFWFRYESNDGHIGYIQAYSFSSFLKYFGIVWDGWGLVLLYMFSRIPLWHHQVLDFSLLRVLFIAISISLFTISQFSLSVSSWINLGRLHVPRNLSNSSRLSKLLAYNGLQYSHDFFFFFCIYVISVVISFFYYWDFFFYYWVF